MTFDTWDSYNTDEAYKDKGTTAKGLVAAYKKDNPNGSAEDFYSKLNKTWAEDKDGNVKNAVNEAFTAPKAEPKAEEKPVVEEMTQTTEALKPETQSNIRKDDKKFLEGTNAIADEQEKTELDKIIDYRSKDWDNTVDNMKQQGKAFKTIDDHFIEQLPTFLFKRYTNGEFGDPKSSDAKLRLAYFVMNGLQTQLQRFSNGAAIAAGRAPLYQGVQSAYEQYQDTNLSKGMENRWKKYEAETDAAIKLAEERGMKEEEAYDTVKTISRNQRLQTAFNMMNEKQKVYLMNVTKEIGDKIGSFDNKELIDFLTGAAVSGDQLTWQEAAAIAVARFGPDAVKAAKAGKGKISGDDVTAGIGGSGNAKKGDTVLYDGTVIKNVGKLMSDKEFNQVASAADKLREDYNSGKIDKETFNSEYAKLEDIMKDHKLYTTFKKNLKSAETSDKEVTVDKWNELSSSLEELNANAKNMSKDDYLEQYEDLKANAVKWGIGDKELKAMEKGKEKSLKAIEKASKKK